MRGVVIHAPKDLRVDDLREQTLGARDIRVRVAAGGICGSDLHYYNHGGTGAIRLREPMVLGHELAGTVVETGGDVGTITTGARIAVNPSRACGGCQYCQRGLHNHCTDMRFMGSAMRMPHVQGGFRQDLVVDAAQAVPIADSVGMAEAAMAEPLAVCLHAVSRAGSLLGRRVLVTGCGPIGLLAVIAARYAGAADIVATDIQPFALQMALKVGADTAIDVADAPNGLAVSVAQSGRFDVLLEASGTATALRAALDHLHPRGVAVQIGLGGDIALPINTIVTREIDFRGTFRFDTEFALAVDLMNQGRVDVTPLLTASMPFDAARQAFELAVDRSQSVKVQLSFA